MNCYEREIRLLRKFIYDHIGIEKEENMTSECDKRKLIGGRMVVKLRNGTKLMAFAGKAGLIFVDISDTGFGPCYLRRWDEDLKWEGGSFDLDHNPDYDIVKLYKPANCYSIEDRLNFNDECVLTSIDDPVIDYAWSWRRSERKTKEMTMAEIEKELGYPVKIVKKHKCNYYQSQEQLVDVGDPILFDKGCPGR